MEIKTNLIRGRTGLAKPEGSLPKDQLTRNYSETSYGSTTWPNYQKPSIYLGTMAPGSAREKGQP